VLPASQRYRRSGLAFRLTPRVKVWATFLKTFPNGCQIAEVKIDPNTGGVVIEGYTVVDDFGRTVNSLLLESQVPGGIVQGIGQALFEHAVYDPDTDRLVHGLRHAARWRCSALRFLNS
jgi:CO/xanthine dehydrogenase Mo-binding subunit